MERRNGQSQGFLGLLPSICEYREFGTEEDYQRTGTNSKLFKTRKAFPTLTQRFGDEEEPEGEERPLLSFYTQDCKVFDEEWQPKRTKPSKHTEGRAVQSKRRGNKVRDREDQKSKPKPKPNKLAKGRTVVQKRRGKIVRGEEGKPRGWKMHKKRVNIAWAKSRGYRQSLRSSLKVFLSDCPLFLVKALRDAYVSMMTSMASKCNQRMWYLAGARLL